MSDGKDAAKEASEWWATAIIDMKPGEIRYHGYAIGELIGHLSFSGMIWLMLKGERATTAQTTLLDAALMAAVDHGPQAPSIAMARMAMTCGVGINNAMASAVNALGEVHGGAGEQALIVFKTIADSRVDLHDSTRDSLDRIIASGQNHIPGFGHRFHPIDPRAEPLLGLIDRFADRPDIDGRYATIARAVETDLERRKGKRIPMNIDGATAAIYGALGFTPQQARGLFCLSRSVGILAHADEESHSGARNKGPIPRDVLPTYRGVPPRSFEPETEPS